MQSSETSKAVYWVMIRQGPYLPAWLQTLYVQTVLDHCQTAVRGCQGTFIAEEDARLEDEYYLTAALVVEAGKKGLKIDTCDVKIEDFNDGEGHRVKVVVAIDSR